MINPFQVISNALYGDQNKQSNKSAASKKIADKKDSQNREGIHNYYNKSNALKNSHSARVYDDVMNRRQRYYTSKVGSIVATSGKSNSSSDSESENYSSDGSSGGSYDGSSGGSSSGSSGSSSGSSGSSSLPPFSCLPCL